MSLDYTPEEVAVIRRAIAPPPPTPPEEVIEAMRPPFDASARPHAALLETIRIRDAFVPAAHRRPNGQGALSLRFLSGDVRAVAFGARRPARAFFRQDHRDGGHTAMR